MQHSVLKNVPPTGRSGGVTTRQAELRWEQKQAPQSEVRLAAPFAPHPSLPVTRRLRTLSRQTFLESEASGGGISGRIEAARRNLDGPADANSDSVYTHMANTNARNGTYHGLSSDAGVLRL